MKKLLLLLTLLFLPLNSWAVNVSKLNDGLTRTMADELFSKDYDFMVLSDISVRREWNLKDAYVILDFNLSTDKLIMAQIRYKTPINSKLAIADAVKMAGSKLPTWKKAKTSQANSVGLGDCFYTQTENGNYFFVEVNGKNNALSTVFFASAPKSNRRTLSEASTQGYTAMGHNANADAAATVYEDELARLTADSKKGQASSTTVKTTTSHAKSSAIVAENGDSTEKIVVVEKKSEHALTRGEIVGAAALILLAIIIMVFAARKKHHPKPPTNGVRSLKK